MPRKGPRRAATTREGTSNWRHKMTAPERTVTMRLHVPWDAESSERLYRACRTQDACWNLALDFLIDRPTEPLRKSKRLGVKGLQGRWLEWRQQHSWGKAVPQVIWRGGVLRAKEQIERWEQVNEVHAKACMKAIDEEREIARRIQRRYPDPAKLYRRRKDRDRQRRNTCLVTEGVKAIDAHTVHIPGVGEVQVRETLPEDIRLRSCTIVERTTEDRARRCGRHMKGRERTFEVHVQVRVPVGTGEGLERLEAVGIDHGIVHPVTTYDTLGNIHHYWHRETELAALDGRVKKIQRTLRNCRRGSREWRKRQRLVKRLRGRAAAIRSHDRRQWAVGLAKGYETVCCERMDVRQLIRSNRGTHEKHGDLVNVQRELSRRLANAAPGEQRAELKSACERHGAKYIETPARNSSDFCPECGHCSPENRKTQARFRCQECGHTDNADANAARNHLAWGTSAKHRAAVRRSWEETTPSKRRAGGDNVVRAPTANRGNAPGRQRDPGSAPTPPSERSLPPVIATGIKAGASEAAANSE